MNKQGLLEQAANEVPEADQKIVNQVKQAYPVVLNVIGDEQMMNSLVDDAKGQPAYAVLGYATAEVSRIVQQEVKGLDIQVLSGIGMLIIGELSDILNKIGFQVTEQDQEKAMDLAVKLFLQKADKQTQQQAQQLTEQEAQAMAGGA